MKSKKSKKVEKVSLPSIQDYLKYVKSENKTTSDNTVGYSHYVYVK
jgi:hypothetical protein